MKKDKDAGTGEQGMVSDNRYPPYPYPNGIGLICHHDPDRSFFCNGKQFPVCARCTGIYGALLPGILLGGLITYLAHVDRFYFAAVVLIAMLPAVIDGGTQYIGWRMSNNRLRLVTGTLGGLGMGAGFGWLIVNFARLLGS